MGRRRLRRLQNDHEQMIAMHGRNGLIHIIAMDGDPPERYLVGFRCRGVAAIDEDGEPQIRDDHQVELILTIEYPRLRPLMHWLTPIFHPNFDGAGGICIKEWYPQQTLRELCEVLAEMVQYKNYNTTSPLNMDAAMWAMQARDRLPIDGRNLYIQSQGTAPNPPVQTVYGSARVVRGTLPIALPQVEEETAFPSGKPALYCGKCGFKFPNVQILFCPQCGYKRRMI